MHGTAIPKLLPQSCNARHLRSGPRYVLYMCRTAEERVFFCASGSFVFSVLSFPFNRFEQSAVRRRTFQKIDDSPDRALPHRKSLECRTVRRFRRQGGHVGRTPLPIQRLLAGYSNLSPGRIPVHTSEKYRPGYLRFFWKILHAASSDYRKNRIYWKDSPYTGFSPISFQPRNMAFSLPFFRECQYTPTRDFRERPTVEQDGACDWGIR